MFKDDSGNYKLKIAFDFDGTLSEPDMFLLAWRLIKRGHDVWIITARTSAEDMLAQYDIEHGEDYNADLYKVAKMLGIEEKIIFVGIEKKSIAYLKYGFDLLLDDDAEWQCNAVCRAGGMAVNV